MKFVIRTISLLLFCMGTLQAAYAINFKSIGSSPAILYDAPSEKGKRMYIAPRNMPVEVVLNYGEWSKIRDVSGTLSWVHAKELVDARYVVIKTKIAKVYLNTNVDSAVVFTANQHVLLELVEPSTVFGWIKVKHQSGQTGYIKSTDIWGA